MSTPLQWLTEKVEEGKGAFVLSLTEDGDIGLFKDGVEENLGHGDTVLEAITDAYIRSEAQS